MTPQPENSTLVFRRLVLISLLVLVPLLFLNAERNKLQAFGKNTATTQVVAADHGALLLPAGIADAGHKLKAAAGTHGYPELTDRTGSGFSICRVEPILYVCGVRFCQIKPVLFAIHFHPIRSSSGDGDLPLIS